MFSRLDRFKVRTNENDGAYYVTNEDMKIMLEIIDVADSLIQESKHSENPQSENEQNSNLERLERCISQLKLNPTYKIPPFTEPVLMPELKVPDQPPEIFNAIINSSVKQYDESNKTIEVYAKIGNSIRITNEAWKNLEERNLANAFIEREKDNLVHQLSKDIVGAISRLELYLFDLSSILHYKALYVAHQYCFDLVNWLRRK